MRLLSSFAVLTVWYIDVTFGGVGVTFGGVGVKFGGIDDIYFN